MTAKELETTLLTLGCVDFQEEEFNYSVNAALKKLYNDCVIIKHGVIYAHGITPFDTRKDYFHKAGETKSYPMTGKAFSVKLSGGAPKVIVGTGSGTTTYLLNDGVTVLKGFIDDNAAIISFCGDYVYTATDICCYNQIVSSRREQIPDGPDITIYDVTNYIDDFRSFESMPTDASGNPIEDLLALNDKITVKAGYTGELHFNYRAGPCQTVYFNSDAEIYIPKEYEMLLVPLFLAIYFVNIDPDRANDCMELYLSLLAGVPESKEHSYNPPEDQSMTAEYSIKDGWA